MKVAVIGDVHGRVFWEKVKDMDVDHTVFIGDYVDSFDVSDDDIFINFHNIIDFKALNPDKVTLLLGNHDMQYAMFPKYRCSGFRVQMRPKLTSWYMQHQSKFQFSTRIDNRLYTHAGVNQWWADNTKADLEKLDDCDIEDLMMVGQCRGGMNHMGGPLWCDFDRELKRHPYIGLKQVVGHTQRSNGIEVVKIDDKTELINVDCLLTSLSKIPILDENGMVEAPIVQ